MHILLLYGEIPLLFTKRKEYAGGSGYVALENKEKQLCMLCRYLDEDSSLLFGKNHILCDCTNVPLTNSTIKEIGRYVLLLSDQVTNFEMADKMVESYRVEPETLKRFSGLESD